MGQRPIGGATARVTAWCLAVGVDPQYAHLMRNISKLWGLFFVLGGCVGTSYQPPTASAPMLASATLELQRAALDKQMARRARLYDLAWPVLRANTDLCSHKRPSIGVVIADQKMMAMLVGGLREPHIAALGIPEGARVVHVMKESPADAAGVRVGMMLTSVGDTAIERDAKLTASLKKITKALKADKQVSLGFGDVEVDVPGAEICDIGVKMSQSSALNAFAHKKEIVLNGALINALSDDGVQFIIGHEVAHIALKHRTKIIRNSLSSGAVIYGPVLVSLGIIGDRVKGLSGNDHPVSLSGKAVAAAVPYMSAFEAEADYVGLYMLARAGGNLDAAREVFALFATESPSSTWIKYTHPLTADRFSVTSLTIAEIATKREAGAALVPEKR